jgi:hypothetical protein
VYLDAESDAEEEDAELSPVFEALGWGRAGGLLELSLLYHSKPLLVISDNLVATMSSTPIELQRHLFALFGGSAQSAKKLLIYQF